METKTCTRCGEVKCVDAFRNNYGGRRGTFTYCTECERLHQRFKYLTYKKLKSEEETQELTKIQQIYDSRERAGLKSPGYTKRGGTVRPPLDLDAMLKKYS